MPTQFTLFSQIPKLFPPDIYYGLEFHDYFQTTDSSALIPSEQAVARWWVAKDKSSTGSLMGRVRSFHGIFC